MVLAHELYLLLGQHGHVLVLLLLARLVVGRGAGGLRLVVQVDDLLVHMLHHLPHLQHVAGRQAVPGGGGQRREHTPPIRPEPEVFRTTGPGDTSVRGEGGLRWTSLCCKPTLGSDPSDSHYGRHAPLWAGP